MSDDAWKQVWSHWLRARFGSALALGDDHACFRGDGLSGMGGRGEAKEGDEDEASVCE